MAKTRLHCMVMDAVLRVSYVPLEKLHPMIPHVNRIQLVHIRLYQVLFGMCLPCSYVLDEKELIP